MGDATLPTPGRSSASAHQSTQPLDLGSRDNDAFPFLVHSQSSVTNGEPPAVDNGKLARQKRRRTSAEDQATLEAEYKRNSKPDKLARLEIVKRVSLGEKEVQIWFQNRRQNTRRKSRPLLPHEVAAFGLGGMAAMSSVSSSNSTFSSSQSTAETQSSSQDTDSASNRGAANPPLGEPSSSPESERASVELVEEDSYKGANNECLPSIVTPKNTSDLRSYPVAMPTESLILPQNYRYEQLPHAVGYLSNRRNPCISLMNAQARSQASNFTTSPDLTSLDEVNRSTSLQVRLSLSLDGKAELISTDLSPPRSTVSKTSLGTSVKPRRQRSFRRSQSALPFGPIQKSASNAPFVPRMPSGRSRDARTWEFCCDPDARDELTKQAENESSGSAVAAINLLRSTNTSALKTNVGKRNYRAQKPETNRHGKRPKLGRSSSSFAVMQSTDKTLAKSPGDSDKENWMPLEVSGNPRRQPLPATRPQKGTVRRILEEPRTASKCGSDLSLQTKPGGRPTAAEVEILEDNGSNVEVNQEVEKLLKGEVSPSKKGDLDCIQGLLSLSQGNWR